MENNIKPTMQKFSFKDFTRKFPDDDTCLEYLRRKLYPNKTFCTNCRKPTKHHKITGRRQYACQECGKHFAPTASTIFHKSSTPLTTWFYTIYLMAQTRGGISAKQIQRETGVTYKTAWRMCNEIRKRLDEGISPFGGEVEVDDSYFGGRHKGKRGRGAEGKTPVLGMVESKRKIKAVAVSNLKTKTIKPHIENQVDKKANVYTDEFRHYNILSRMGYDHQYVLNGQGINVIGNVHNSTIEGFWSLVKNGICGVFHSVSPQHL